MPGYEHTISNSGMDYPSPIPFHCYDDLDTLPNEGKIDYNVDVNGDIISYQDRADNEVTYCKFHCFDDTAEQEKNPMIEYTLGGDHKDHVKSYIYKGDPKRKVMECYKESGQALNGGGRPYRANKRSKSKRSKSKRSTQKRPNKRRRQTRKKRHNKRK